MRPFIFTYNSENQHQQNTFDEEKLYFYKNIYSPMQRFILLHHQRNRVWNWQNTKLMNRN
jgi:hypothetical protein